jgi:D-cysteine desulfhydrase
MNFARFPRRRYLEGWTPLEKLARLTAKLGGATIYMKRDDLAGSLAAGGNKLRKLEFVVADALAQGADTLITSGAIQSNHCRLTLAAANKEGLKCRLVLVETVPGTYTSGAGGNYFLYQLLGAEKVRIVPGGSDLGRAVELEADEAAAEGRRAYLIPVGASNPLGALGYVACAEEILAQIFQMGLRVDAVVCASGSAGTHAGLLVGFWGNNGGIPVVGINVSREKEAQEEMVWGLAKRTAEAIGVRGEIPRGEVVCFGDYVGQGYSIPTPGMVEAVTAVARSEAILLDPVYTGKAMAGLIDLIRKGYFRKDQNILFLHTGGIPALYEYMKSFRDS